PILLLYKNPEKLSNGFKLILNQKDILMTNEDTAILVAARSHAQILDGKINKTNQQKLNSTFQKAKNEIYRFLAQKTKFHIQSIKRELQREYASYDLKINKALIQYYRGAADY